MRIGSFALLPVAALALGATLTAVACGTTEETPPAADGGSSGTPTDSSTTPPSTTGLPCDVDKVLANNCRKCHSSPPQFGAPFPLVTHGDLTAPSKGDPSKKIYDLVLAKTGSTGPDVMPPPPNAPLSAADRAVLSGWVAGGAPSSTESCTAPEGGPIQPGVKCTPNLPIGPATPYEMPAASGDEYVCYGVELTNPTPTHITGFVPRVDNSKIVHHIVLFEAPSAYSSTPTPCNSGGSLQWRMVMGWAPGAKGFELPPEAGFPIKTSGATHYVVQMHYSNPTALTGQKDTSGFDLCTGPPRANEADVLAFGTQNINVKARATLDQTCSLTVQPVLGLSFEGIHLIAAMPHMHQMGTEMSTKLTPKAGGPEHDLGTDLKFSFQTQAWYPIGTTPQGVVLHDGDKIATRCKWVNTTDSDVKYGENTADEMCYSFTMYYPKIQSPIGWSWAAPATVSQCQ
ncbi:MAG: peptidylglycine alpha-amidating monooxygenase [Deltaproteobacteria bacterium]|nr:peptidylglycine alpha-amidating monooxygenase [Deltaproteobacteria bacterium]